ncbi:DinB family protein [Rhodohalobacter barkolensis]|uniref:Damage-inducible protein DinB n=1 Tax=Rhodohalobacter barkolensis TaxID=2053187 RepID=A0A2N0VG86_9BACT|nr:DinB family protein [Rhodohalobacter barkolensis]PKD43189.1 hypothetical protein CWD77_11255 [Rhodohalobacter barkolensis]
MDQRQPLQLLFTYDLWCTRKLLDHISRQTPFKNEVACRAFLAHIVNIQDVWYSRVVDTSMSESEKWDEYKPAELRRKAKQLNRKWIDLIGDHEVNLDAEIYYLTEKRVKKSAVLNKICRHIIVHGEYHRAQISLFLRNCDIKPPKIDYADYRSGR